MERASRNGVGIKDYRKDILSLAKMILQNFEEKIDNKSENSLSTWVTVFAQITPSTCCSSDITVTVHIGGIEADIYSFAFYAVLTLDDQFTGCQSNPSAERYELISNR